MAKYIDAERALFVVKGLRGPTRSPAQNELIQRAIAGIERLPAADVKPVRHGRWLINPDGYAPYCSECKQEPTGGIMTDYCDHCGAKMDGGGGQDAQD